LYLHDKKGTMPTPRAGEMPLMGHSNKTCDLYQSKNDEEAEFWTSLHEVGGEICALTKDLAIFSH
jgi:hypothetical protein